MKTLLVLCFFAALTSAQAAIQYAGGTNVNATCTAAAGTKQELSDCIEDNLVVAGWTVISGSHTTSVLLESLVTPASLQMRLALTQGTNCVILKGRNVANTKAATTGQFLLPAVAKVFRVIANKYQYFIATAGTPPARSIAAGGVLYVPSFAGITEGIWTWGNSNSDTDTGIQNYWKVTIGFTSGGPVGSQWVTVNGTQFENTASSLSNTGSPGVPQLISPQSGQSNISPTIYRWFDGSSFISEPLIAIGASLVSEAKVTGQLWDAAIITDSVASETALTFDSKNWLTFTNSNVGAAGKCARGTLVLVVP